MVYYQDDELLIRDMEAADAQIICDAHIAQGWHDDIGGYQVRLKDQAEGRCIALIAVYQGNVAGHVYLYLNADEGPFKGNGWPIIVDFGVLEKYQRRGVGSRLMDAAEQIAGQHADTVCLGVGLCREYGSAQRMYARVYPGRLRRVVSGQAMRAI